MTYPYDLSKDDVNDVALILFRRGLCEAAPVGYKGFAAEVLAETVIQHEIDPRDGEIPTDWVNSALRVVSDIKRQDDDISAMRSAEQSRLMGG